MAEEESQPTVPPFNMADEESQPTVPTRQEKVKKLLEKNQKGVSSAALPIMAVPTIVIGHIYLFDCKVQPCIPIYLLVSGYSNILASLLQIVMGCCWKDNTACKIVKYWSYQMLIFIMVWSIVGSVWVYGVKKVDYEDITSEEYCNKTLYYFSWWLLTIHWSILAFLVGLVILCFCGYSAAILCGQYFHKF